MKKTIVAVVASANILATAITVQAACNDNLPRTTPSSEFTIHDNATVSHVPTGLMWMRCSLGQSWDGSTCTGEATTYQWQAALSEVEAFNSAGGFAGYTDWRLPNKNELASIVERNCSNPSVNTTVFPNTPLDWFWTSSPYADDEAGAWNISFDGGCVIASRKDENDRIRLVRGGH